MKDKAINKKIGEQIRMLRLGQNYSQEALADELELSVSTLSNLERGETEFTVARLYKFLKIMNVDIIDFFRILHKQGKTNVFSDDQDEYRKNVSDTELLKEEIRLIKLELEKLANR